MLEDSFSTYFIEAKFLFGHLSLKNSITQFVTHVFLVSKEMDCSQDAKVSRGSSFLISVTSFKMSELASCCSACPIGTLIPCLTSFPKQCTEVAHNKLPIHLSQQIYCLGPDFFRILILSCSSATSIFVSRAMLFIWACSNSFSRALSCL